MTTTITDRHVRSQDQSNRSTRSRKGRGLDDHDRGRSAPRRADGVKPSTAKGVSERISQVNLESRHAAPVDSPRRSSRLVAASRRFGQLWERLGDLISRNPADVALIAFSAAVALVMILPFGSDFLFGWPMRNASPLFDAANALCGFGLLFLCWNTFRDLR